jgi:AcrR family transcriptional regulator
VRKKAKRKRRYVEREDIRETLLDAAEALVREEGYAAATARRIANRVGLKHQVVFYYFGTQEDLLLALYQRTAAANRTRLADALNSGKVYAAALDVVSLEPIKKDNPLLTATNCIITPHIAWAPIEARQRLLDITIDNVTAFLEGNPVNSVS